MLNKKIKSGFTLIELMVFFIFISLIMAAATPIITKRVKNIPLKFNHGKFICYGDHYELYNSSRLVSSGTGCQFTPPRRTALYKIELIGGGAGGFSYTEPVTEDMVEGEGGYKMDSGHYGDGYTDISESQAWNAFKGAEFVRTINSGNGGAGTGVSMEYTPAIYNIIKPKCFEKIEKTCTREVDDTTKPIKDAEGKITGYEKKKETYDCSITEDPNGELMSCSEQQTRLSKAETNIYLYKARICPNTYSSSYSCTPLNAAVIDYAEQQYASVPVTISSIDTNHLCFGWAASGGKGVRLYLKGNIDFKNYYSGEKYQQTVGITKYPKEYLKKLLSEYYQTGTVQYAGSCDGWGYYETDAKRDGSVAGSDSNNVGLVNNSSEKTGKWGYNVMYYAAVKGWGKCATNATRATGGEGGNVYYTSSAIKGSVSAARFGKDAGGIAGSVGGPVEVGIDPDAKNRTPYVITKTKLNQRHHAVGDGGGAGSYEVAYVPSLADDCVFRVARGGAAINDQVPDSNLKFLHEQLATTLSCNEGTLKLKADGGYYSKKIIRATYGGLGNITPSGSPKHQESYAFKTAGYGEGGKYIPSSVFTKYKFNGGGDFGKGGDGSAIIDTCTDPYGHYWIWLSYIDEDIKIAKENQEIHRRNVCDPKNDIMYRSEAGSGGAGVIMISW